MKRPTVYHQLRLIVKVSCLGLACAIATGNPMVTAEEPSIAPPEPTWFAPINGANGEALREITQSPTPVHVEQDDDGVAETTDVSDDATALNETTGETAADLVEELSESLDDLSRTADIHLPDPSAQEPELAPEPELAQEPELAPEPRVADATEPAGPVLTAPKLAIPPHVESLRRPVQQALLIHAPKMLNTQDDSYWSMMHTFLGWGPEAKIRVGGERGRITNALPWLTQNRPCAGRQMFYLSESDLIGREGPGYQGHQGQFMAILAQCGVPADQPMIIQGRRLTMADLVATEQRKCHAQKELTFKLIGFAHYLNTDAEWQSETGEAWNFPKMLQIELAQPINGAACGGTHRIMGLTCAVRYRRAEGKPVDGQWWRAEKYVSDYQAYTLTTLNRDGSFSSDWFRKRSDWGGIDRKIQTTGHILEWLVYSLPQEELYDARVVRAVSLLSNLLIQHRYHDFEVGPKGHAIRALRLYNERVFDEVDWSTPSLAQKISTESSR